MKKTVYYTYLGTNGVITSPVHLEGIYYTNKYFLEAEEGKKLTKDGINFYYSKTVPENELSDWYEV